jgi:GAF domain-containing protein
VILEREPLLQRAAAGAADEVFRRLADLVYTCDDYPQMYQAICEAALGLVEGCHHASLMLEQGGRLLTVAATDEIARRIDRLERQIGEGPCVDAIKEDTAQLEPDLTIGSAWPRLSERIVAETPVRSMAGFRLVVDDRKAGALNLFSDDPYGLTGASVDQAGVLAAFTSVTLAAATHREQARTLREGLASNREIGKAVGLMMAFHKVADDEAFGILRKASQEMNVKLSEVARQVVDHHNRRPPS